MAGAIYGRLEGFIILRPGKGFTSFNTNNRANVYRQKKLHNEAFRDVHFFLEYEYS